MPASERFRCSPESPCRPLADRTRGSVQHHSFVDSVLTDAVLEKLKEQSTAGCLLCSLEEWDEEDWD